jgi:fatty-acyl-CoA synthase
MSLAECDTAHLSARRPLSPAKSWVRALELTASIAERPERLLSSIIEEFAERSGNASALLSDRESMTFRELAERSNQCTRWALRHGLGKGDTICLLMSNRPEYMAIWLGLARAGCTVALVNTNLVGPSLAHSINIVAPKHVIVGDELLDHLTSALPDCIHTGRIWVHGSPAAEFACFDADLAQLSTAPLEPHERPSVTIHDRALFIYTSGTTGLPKAANISHARLMQWSQWFAGLMDTAPEDRLYNCLPM